MTEVHRYNLERWKILIQDKMNSDMNLDDWCRYKGVSKHAYYYWLKRVLEENLPAALDQLKKESQSPTLIDITPALDNTMNLTKNTSDNYVTAPSAIIRKNGLEIE
ncbi:MAG: hypothetical protein K5894_10660, partial [Lachnospiraceae bacterium]|nr:hypothetical protein [Lachnospiraceae bacterium]